MQLYLAGTSVKNTITSINEANSISPLTIDPGVLVSYFYCATKSIAQELGSEKRKVFLDSGALWLKIGNILNGIWSDTTIYPLVLLEADILCIFPGLSSVSR